ncbi:hypothetical protein GGX14DRAFT_572455 [Mycena pura]|uniref:Uncharacterized protein n=1 Tax=Mycena pura TaxID=153505 RepID=A0AAD6V161_9AGAR|nr:hypothetical protein GGX14DRAFT_572455 [Mycena pura]
MPLFCDPGRRCVTASRRSYKFNSKLPLCDGKSLFSVSFPHSLSLAPRTHPPARKAVKIKRKSRNTVLDAPVPLQLPAGLPRLPDHSLCLPALFLGPACPLHCPPAAQCTLNVLPAVPAKLQGPNYSQLTFSALPILSVACPVGAAPRGTFNAAAIAIAVLFVAGRVLRRRRHACAALTVVRQRDRLPMQLD